MGRTTRSHQAGLSALETRMAETNVADAARAGEAFLSRYSGRRIHSVGNYRFALRTLKQLAETGILPETFSELKQDNPQMYRSSIELFYDLVHDMNLKF